VSGVFAEHLQASRPTLSVHRQPARVVAAASWWIEDRSGQGFYWGCARGDGVTAEGVNLELPPPLRGTRLTSDLREALAAALRAAGATSLAFDAGQDGAVLWARRLPGVTWDRERMIVELPAMIDSAVAQWPCEDDVHALLTHLRQACALPLGTPLSTLSETARWRLLTGTVGPGYFTRVVAPGAHTVTYRGFTLGLGEYVLTQREGWRGVDRL
jgi:hypothetical protein